MTQEQIKQAANEYANKMEWIRGELEWVATRDDFIAGAEWAERKMNNETLRHCIEFAVGVVIGFVVMFLITAL